MSGSGETGAVRARPGDEGRTSRWVLALIFVLASIEPVSHVWVQYFPPEGAVPSGALASISATLTRFARLATWSGVSPSRLPSPGSAPWPMMKAR